MGLPKILLESGLGAIKSAGRTAHEQEAAIRAAKNATVVEQLKNFAEPGDVVIAISGSGNSPNVLQAVEYANSIGCRTIALSGRDGGRLGPMAQLNLQASHPHMGRIEDVHMIVLHMIGYYFMDAEKPAAAGV